MARRTPGMRSTPGRRGGGPDRGLRSPTAPRRQYAKTPDAHARGRKVMKAAKIATGNVGRAQQGVRSVGRGGAVTKSGTTAAAFRARAPVDKTEPARQAAARTAGMKVGLPTSRPVGSVGLPIATSRPVRKATRVSTRNPHSRGSGRR